jgi:hypothetical protein
MSDWLLPILMYISVAVALGLAWHNFWLALIWPLACIWEMMLSLWREP